MITQNDALEYMKAVKKEFEDKPEIYEAFTQVIRDYRSQSLDVDGVVKRIKELFKGHKDLILGFSVFVPHGYEFPFEPEDEQEQPGYEDALRFSQKLTARFQNEFHVCKSFLDIILLHKNGSKSFTEVSQELAILLREHLDLYEEFVNLVSHTSRKRKREEVHHVDNDKDEKNKRRTRRS